ncbi:MAG: regulator of sigma D [Gammaproteobacteria bacterium]
MFGNGQTSPIVLRPKLNKGLVVSDTQIGTVEEMAQKISAEIDRRERQSHTIQELLTERQEVLVAMCGLAELESKEAKFSVVLKGLNTFSQALVDYSALGHFEIYERIIDGRERRGNVKKVANSVYPVISQTTEQFVEFNDKYDGSDDHESLENLYKDLSLIGEAMADRIESEDQLLQELNEEALKESR